MVDEDDALDKLDLFYILPETSDATNDEVPYKPIAEISKVILTNRLSKYQDLIKDDKLAKEEEKKMKLA